MNSLMLEVLMISLMLEVGIDDLVDGLRYR